MDEARRRDFEFALFPILRTESGVRYLAEASKIDVAVETWTNQTLFPRRDKFIIDVVGQCRDGTILHIEQETSPRTDLSIRMLEYSSLLLIDRELQAKVIQIVFYTGDGRKKWEGAKQLSSGVFTQTHSLGYLQFKYVIVDAGAPTSERISTTGFPAAALGLLTRNEEQALEIARTLVRKILGIPSQERREDAIVACKQVASLRGWSEMFSREMDRGRISEMSADVTARAYSRVFAGQLLSVLNGLIKRNERIEENDIQPYLNEDLGLMELERLIMSAPTATSASDLLDSANIEVQTRTPQ